MQTPSHLSLLLFTLLIVPFATAKIELYGGGGFDPTPPEDMKVRRHIEVGDRIGNPVCSLFLCVF